MGKKLSIRLCYCLFIIEFVFLLILFFNWPGFILRLFLNPLTPMSDQEIISPYSVNTISSRQVMRINKNIN